MIEESLAGAVRRHGKGNVATAAHEIGHTLHALDVGIVVDHVRLETGLLGGVHRGQCEVVDDRAPEDPISRKIAWLVFHLAGHAAETRFRQLYLGHSFRKAYRDCRDDAAGDYWRFNNDRKRFDLRRISEDWAFGQATDLMEQNAGRLDQLTVRLVHTHRIPMSRL